jgi:hypothetical protein
MDRMKKVTNRDIKVEVFTGEAYYDYTDYSDIK